MTEHEQQLEAEIKKKNEARSYVEYAYTTQKLKKRALLKDLILWNR